MSERDVSGPHLSQEELELFVPRLREEGPGPRREQRDHLEGCGRCRRELRALRSLDEVLAGLPDLAPSPGFTEAVMQRVRLPVPWYRRLWARLAQHWMTVALTASGAVSGGLVAWGVATRPALTFGGLAEFTLERISALFWSLVVAAGRLAWRTGIPDALAELVRSVDPVEALLGMAVLAMCSLTAGAVMARLYHDETPPRMRAAGSGR